MSKSLKKRKTSKTIKTIKISTMGWRKTTRLSDIQKLAHGFTKQWVDFCRAAHAPRGFIKSSADQARLSPFQFPATMKSQSTFFRHLLETRRNDMPFYRQEL